MQMERFNLLTINNKNNNSTILIGSIARSINQRRTKHNEKYAETFIRCIDIMFSVSENWRLSMTNMTNI